MLSPMRRRAARFILVLAVLLSSFGPAAPASHHASPIDATATGEVRLRKLHLVRPDLIRYPMALDVYC